MERKGRGRVENENEKKFLLWSQNFSTKKNWPIEVFCWYFFPITWSLLLFSVSLHRMVVGTEHPPEKLKEEQLAKRMAN
jgi:hypothetical protein